MAGEGAMQRFLIVAVAALWIGAICGATWWSQQPYDAAAFGRQFQTEMDAAFERDPTLEARVVACMQGVGTLYSECVVTSDGVVSGRR
jgi:hypothetical protein